MPIDSSEKKGTWVTVGGKNDSPMEAIRPMFGNAEPVGQLIRGLNITGETPSL